MSLLRNGVNDWKVRRKELYSDGRICNKLYNVSIALRVEEEKEYSERLAGIVGGG